ncbi:MAG TPA: DNA mismatch repair protein MutS [Kiritimatiellia bacterium]|nr:DNA mismatch repair protein MutS [Kiritimatiellia bacterium]HMP33246.1 DNA mismatch repair protein MutS [Kiritimatiellia bacterium]
MSETSTPMMQQYRRIRNELPPDTILFFRMGDFYEMFFDDAKVAASVLDIALTKRQGIPMCGVPFHSSDNYLSRLIRAGKKVAICEQMEDPATAKGIVRREVTRVVTPGTVLEDQVLDSRRNNYLAGLCAGSRGFGLALVDLSTGAFWLEETADAAAIRENLARYQPSEIIVPSEKRDDAHLADILGAIAATTITPYDDWTFDYDAAHDQLLRHFKVHSLDGFGVGSAAIGVCAAGAVLHYVSQQLRRPVEHVRSLRVKNPAAFMLLDEATIRNLDLVEGSTRAPGGAPTSLLGVLDATRTAMGGRLLRDWLIRPLVEAAAIRERLDAVETLVNHRGVLHPLRDALAEVKDLERLIARLNAGTGNARDVRALGRSVAALPDVIARTGEAASPLFTALLGEITPLPELVDLIDRAIVDEPPVSLRDGGVIRPGYHPELDELKDASTKGRNWLVELQAREQERTGIKTLKVRHNKVFGYYIEISKSYAEQAPADYQRKQTLVNAERFITPELKEYENKILGAQERSIELELELFNEVRDRVVAHTASIQQTAAAIAQLDVLAALADRAIALRYVRPSFNHEGRIAIKDGRHPVIETLPQAERFVPNDTLLDGVNNQVIIITGPNMAGKSTYIRQVAVITIMAHIGSFVPAASADLSETDRVFTRVGASDDLARGRSTFMVEMQETANILNNATPRSLVVLDEIGRGTSTFDGISIAWSVAEYLHNHPGSKARTLFATHYHELTDLAITLAGVKNYNVLVRESGDKIAFLRKIVPGAADKSYGIQVARLAGLPPEVIQRAHEILGNLEEGEFGEGGKPKLAQARVKKDKDHPDQMALF